VPSNFTTNWPVSAAFGALWNAPRGRGDGSNGGHITIALGVDRNNPVAYKQTRGLCANGKDGCTITAQLGYDSTCENARLTGTV